MGKIFFDEDTKELTESRYFYFFSNHLLITNVLYVLSGWFMIGLK